MLFCDSILVYDNQIICFYLYMKFQMVVRVNVILSFVIDCKLMFDKVFIYIQ